MEVKVTQADRAAAENLQAENDIVIYDYEGLLNASESFARHRIASQAELIEALENIQQEARRDNRTMAHLLKCISHQVGTAIAKAKGE